MFTRPIQCPKCKKPGEKFFRKWGYFKTKHNHQPNPRYECLKCGMAFSSHSYRTNKMQKRPDLNSEIFKWVCSGVTINRIAKNLGVNKLTVMRKIGWLAREAHRFHIKAIESGELNTSYVQMDEMESFEHTRLKPLSIALAVRYKTGQIIDAEVAEMNAKGHLAEPSRSKYGWRTDTREAACKSVLQTVKKIAKPNITIACDAKSNYPGLINGIIPDAKVSVHKAEKKKHGDKKHDPLFAINNLCAKLRSDLAPLARRSWATTKNPARLQDLLLIYIAWNNGYDICANTNLIDIPTKSKKPAKPRKSTA